MATTIIIQSIMAEVSDKIPSVESIWLIGLIVFVAIVLLCRLHQGISFVLLPMCLWLIWELYYEFFTDIRSAIISEQGVGYLIQLGVSAGLVLLAVLFFATKTLRRLFRYLAMQQTA